MAKDDAKTKKQKDDEDEKSKKQRTTDDGPVDPDPISDPSQKSK